MADPLPISGTMLRDLVICERKLALDVHGDAAEKDAISPFVQMLWRDGMSHEHEVLGPMSGSAVDLRGLDAEIRTEATIRAIRSKAPTILGSIIHSEGAVGMPDLLQLGDRGYVAMDVKAGAATEGVSEKYKPEYLAQVSHYAHIVSANDWGPSDVAGIIDASRQTVLYDLRRKVGRSGLDGMETHAHQFAQARDIVTGTAETRGALAAHCGFCDWRTKCRADLIAADDLTLIAGLGRTVRKAMMPVAGSVGELASLPDAALGARPGIGSDRLRRFAERARLLADPAAGPVVRAPLDLPRPPHAIDFDVEADPSRGLVYLHGFWHERAGSPAEFVHFFAPTADEAGEREAFEQAIAHFREHRSSHWFHYSAYERTSYRALQRRHPDVCSPEEIDTIFSAERCTDLYAIIASRTDWPLSSYGIKSIAKSCGFSWEDTDPGGAASIEWYDRYVRDGDPALRDRIIAYNRDDVRASARVREALAELETTGRIDAFRRP